MGYINKIQKNQVDYDIHDTRINITSNDVNKLLKVNADLTVGFSDEEPWTIITNATSPIALTNHTDYRFGALTTLSINDASSYGLNFECFVSFTTGSGFTLDMSGVTASIEWFGDDLLNGTPNLQIGKRYNIYFYNNSATSTVALRAIIIGG